MRTGAKLIGFLASSVAAAGVLGGGLAGCNRDVSTQHEVRAAGNEAFARGDYPRALAEFTQLSNTHNYSPRARYDVGRTLYAMGRYDEAAAELEVAYLVDPKVPGLLEAMTDAFVAAGKHDELYAILQSRARQSGKVEDWLLLAESMQRVGSMDEAHSSLINAAIADGGESVEPQLRLAQFYRAIGDEDREMERLRAVMFIDPADESARMRLRELGITPGATLAIQPPEWDPND